MDVWQEPILAIEKDPKTEDPDWGEHWRYLTQMNPESFRELMLLYGKAVWNYAFYLTRRPEVADDITQDVFLNAYRSIGSFRGRSSMKTWLFTITRNAVISYRRTAFVRKVTLMEWVVPGKEAPSAEHEAIEHVRRDEIWALVMKLSMKYREVLILDARYGMTVPQIASVLGVSEGTVKSRLSRARRKVFAMWKEEMSDERE